MDRVHVVSSRGEDISAAPGRSLERHVVAGLEELRRVLEGLVGGARRPASLDLSGHSTRAGKLLRLGDDVIDMLDPWTERFFRRLADDELLPRLNLRAVRLLGCETAVTPTGRRTLRGLAHTLRLPVFGTTKALYKSHYDALGFDAAFEGVLAEAARFPLGG